MSSGYYVEPKRFSKRKDKTAEQQYMDNFMEFTTCIKNISESYSYDNYDKDMFVQTTNETIDEFNKAQANLLEEVENDLKGAENERD